MSNYKLTPEQIKSVFNTSNMNGKSWANIMDEHDAAEARNYALMTPAQKAAHNAHKKKMSTFYNTPPVPASATRRNNGRGASSRRNNGRGASSRRNNRAPTRAAWGSRRNNSRGAAAPSAAFKPRPGKVMRECRDNRTGCERHQATGDCKFIHTGEPEFAHLRANQRL